MNSLILKKGINHIPDFVALLNNNKILVIEYKGEHLDNPDTKEKELIGKVWEEKSSNIFLMAWKKDHKGRGIEAQIKDCLSNKHTNKIISVNIL